MFRTIDRLSLVMDTARSILRGGPDDVADTKLGPVENEWPALAERPSLGFESGGGLPGSQN
jgi:hypothetical protein